MKKLLTLFMCFALVGLYSCSSDDDGDDNGGSNSDYTDLTINASYLKDGVKTPDAGTIVYLFEGFDKDGPGYFVYSGDGKFYSESTQTTKNYTQKGVADNTGKVFFEKVRTIKNCAIVIEPASDKTITKEIGTVVGSNNKVINYTAGQ